MTAKINFKYTLTCKPDQYRVNEDGTIELVFTQDLPREDLMDDCDKYVNGEAVGETQSDMLWESFDHNVVLTNDKGKSIDVSEDW